MRHLMDTKSHNWREAGLARQISARAVKRARLEFLILFPALAGVLLVYGYRRNLFGPDLDIPVRIATVVALMILGWALARDVGRAIGPSLFRRLDPGTAGTVGFLLRLVTVSSLCSLRCASRVWRLRRWPSEARSPPSCSASPPSRRSAISSPAPCCSAPARSAWASACACRAAASRSRGS